MLYLWRIAFCRRPKGAAIDAPAEKMQVKKVASAVSLP